MSPVRVSFKGPTSNSPHKMTFPESVFDSQDSDSSNYDNELSRYSHAAVMGSPRNSPERTPSRRRRMRSSSPELSPRRYSGQRHAPLRVKEPGKYNGKSDVNDFLSQFEILSRYNGWEEEEM